MPLTVHCIAICGMSRMLCLMTAVDGEPRPANLGRGWTVDDSTFGARLALVRQRMQWNIKEAARECGIPAASWGTWENGAMPRRYTEMCRLISQRTGCDHAWLLDGPMVKTNQSLTVDLADLEAIAAALDINPIEFRSELERGSSRDFDLAPADAAATERHSFVDLAKGVIPTVQPRPGTPPNGQAKRVNNRPTSPVPARKRRPRPVLLGDRVSTK